MGMSNSDLFLSDKDLNSMEFNFLAKPKIEIQDHGCQIEENGDQNQETEQQKQEQVAEEDENVVKKPTLGEFKDDEYEDGFRTPTSLDQRIQLIPQCPPAPRKPKSILVRKRKLARRKIILDLSSEIESLFPPATVADLGGKIKKFRREK